MREDARIPVIILSGFLGSGKTTLLRKVLDTPELSNSMIIVNEIGEIGIDHQLLEQSDDKTLLLDNGCMCCQLRGDLQAMLVDLAMRSYRGEMPSFDRVIVETSGLAEPGPIAQTLYSDGPIANDYRLAHVVTLLDPLNAQAREAAPAVASAQVGTADLLVLTKTDIASQAEQDATVQWARSINGFARLVTASHGDIDIALLASATPYSDMVFDKAGSPGLFSGNPQPGNTEGSYLANRLSLHPSNVGSFVMQFDRPLDRSRFDLFLSTLVRMRGEDLLRVKGIVFFEDAPDPHLIQGVRHIYDQPLALPREKIRTEQSTLVFIARKIKREQVAALWQAMEALAP
jgi:G3E family GTPase